MAEERTESVEELRDQLDILWEKHLILLDNYQQAQQQLGRHFSSGFFSLAQASFRSSSRIRYGQDYYDDRMQAARRFSASVDGDAPTIKMQDEPLEKKPAQQPTPPSTPPPETKANSKSEKEEDTSGKETLSSDNEEKDGGDVKPEKEEEAKEEKTKKPPNPLHWFGILVPPQLRASQKSFMSATEGPIIDACNNAQALRQVSLEIRKLRKDIKRAEKRT